MDGWGRGAVLVVETRHAPPLSVCNCVGGLRCRGWPLRSRSHMKRSLHRCVEIVCLIGAAHVVPWGCAPPTTLPPPVPMAEDATAMTGMALVSGPGAARPGALLLGGTEPEIDFTVWGHRKRHGGLLLGGVMFAGTTSLLGAGLYARKSFNNSPDFLIGGQFSGGLLWASVGLPFSIRIHGDVWLYTHPTFGYRLATPLFLPLGLSMPAGRGQISVEATLGLTMENSVNRSLAELGYFDAPLLRFSLGFGFPSAKPGKRRLPWIQRSRTADQP